MNVRIPKNNRPDIKFIKDSIKKELEDERNKTTRRLIKLMCIILHNHRKFGKQRLTQTVMGIVDLIEQGFDHWEGDSGDFWYKIDEELSKLGIDFYPPEEEIK